MKQINNLKDVQKYWKTQEASIHIDKEPGKEHSALVIKGDTASVFTLLCSLIQRLLEYKIMTMEDLEKLINIFK